MKRLAWLMVITLLLSACITARADELAREITSTPEDALWEWASSGEDVSDLTLRQVVYIDEARAAVLASFYPAGWTYALPALALFSVERVEDQWMVASYDYSPDPRLERDVLTFHRQRGNGDGFIPAAYGLVVDERSEIVTLAWDDGTVENIPVRGGAYLGLRPDLSTASALRASALDGASNILAEIAP